MVPEVQIRARLAQSITARMLHHEPVETREGDHIGSQWFLSLLFTSEDPGSNPICLYVNMDFSPNLIAWVSPIGVFFRCLKLIIGMKCAVGCVINKLKIMKYSGAGFVDNKHRGNKHRGKLSFKLDNSSITNRGNLSQRTLFRKHPNSL